MTTDPVWIDFNNDYGINVKSELLLDVDAVNGSLRNIIRCPIGSRRKEREYGSYVYMYLQEPFGPEVAASMLSSLIQSIQRWEPRIVLDLQHTSVVTDYTLPGYIVTVQYRIVATGTVGILTEPLNTF